MVRRLDAAPLDGGEADNGRLPALLRHLALIVAFVVIGTLVARQFTPQGGVRAVSGSRPAASPIATKRLAPLADALHYPGTGVARDMRLRPANTSVASGDPAMTVTFTVVVPPPPPLPPPTTTAPPAPPTVTRLAGQDRIATAVAVSQDEFPAAGSAGAVVLARSDDFADSLAGVPLAASQSAPLLLTETSGLDPVTEAEIGRVLTKGKTVFVLGGTQAIDPSVDSALEAAGYKVVRYDGPNRFGTALAIASHGLGDPSTILLANGLTFPDGLAAGPAAAAKDGAVLFTTGSSPDPDTAAYLAAHPGDVVYAIGGQAASADPAAQPIAGSDRYATAVDVAEKFFPQPAIAGVATGIAFPDALSGGAEIAALGGPLLLTDPATVPPEVLAWINATPSLKTVKLFGGTGAISAGAAAQL